jgi:GT2 family glycosyltransferase
MTVRPVISVVIPTFQKADRLEPLVVALAAQTLDLSSFEVVIVDDCSTDGTADTLERLIEASPLNLRRLRTERNSGGPAKPRNLGWRLTSAPIVAFLDDDCIPEPGWLEAALAAMDDHPSWGLGQGCTLPEEDGVEGSSGRWFVWRRVMGPTCWFEATNIFYRRTALDATGGFDESIKWWGEDTDLGWRVKDAGWESGFVDRAVVRHELIDRGWRWAAKFGWLDHRMVPVAARYPRIRSEGFWRPWAVTRQSAEFALAVSGLALANKWRPAALAAIPYLVFRRPPFRQQGVNRRTISIGFQTVTVDAIRLAGHVRGSIAARVFVV